MYNTHTRNYVYSITYHKTYVKLNILILAIQCDIRKDFAFLKVTPKCSYTLAMRKNTIGIGLWMDDYFYTKTVRSGRAHSNETAQTESMG